MSVSFAGLLFSGALVDSFPIGVGLGLLGAIILGVVFSFGGSYGGAIAGPQDKPAAVLGVSLASTAALLDESQLLSTAIVLVSVTGLVFGLTIYLLGRFSLAGFVRYMPFPVIGGFLGGTGWLILEGGFSFVGTPLNLTTISSLHSPENIIRWLPAVLFGAALLFVLRRYNHKLVLPGFITGGIAASYLLFSVLDAEIMEVGVPLVLGDLPDSIWQLGLVADAMGHADWRYVVAQWPTIAAVVLVSTIALLLNETGIELSTRSRMDFNRDLRSTGIGNVLCGLCGALPGYAYLGLSVLNHRLGASTRLVGILVALICAGVLFLGAGVLEAFPRWVVGGILFYLAFDFLYEWLFESRQTCTAIDYSLVWVIFLCIVAFGILEGVALGIVVTAIVFVINYSRIEIIKSDLTAVEQRSNVQRSPIEEHHLKMSGAGIAILELQGYLFFGTANRVVERVIQKLEGNRSEQPRYFIIDFADVSGADSSAVLSFLKLRHIIIEHEVSLLLTQVDSELSSRLWHGGCITANGACTEFPDLDRGIEWCEEQLLREIRPPLVESGLDRLRSFAGNENGLPEGLSCHLVRQEWLAGSMIFRQGDRADGMYFLDEGAVSIFLESGSDNILRLRKLGPGAWFGEMGVYTGMDRFASVVADRDTVVYHLPMATIENIERENPSLASSLHRFMVSTLSRRLDHANKALWALRRAHLRA